MTGQQAADAVVIYKDGNRVSVHIGMREIVEIERRFKGNVHTVVHPDGSMETDSASIPMLESTLYGAWCALGKPGEFDSWLDTIDELVQEEIEAVPSKPARGAGSASSSPRKRASTSRNGSRTSS